MKDFSDEAMDQAVCLERAAIRILLDRGFMEKEAVTFVESIVSAVMCRILSAQAARSSGRQ